MSFSRRRFLAAGCAAASAPLLLSDSGIFAKESDAAPDFPEFTARSNKSIERANEWLKKTFNRDQGCGVDIGTPSDVSCTAIVGLSLMSQGNSVFDGTLSQWVGKVENYLLDVVRDDRLYVNLNTQVKADLCGYADHHFAALMLGQALGQGTRVEPVQAAMKKLVQQIGAGQSSDGHWGEGRYPRLAAVTGWVSLRGAYAAGLNVRASADTTARYLLQQMKYQGSQNLFVNAAGIRVLYSMQLDETDIGKRAFDTAIRSATHDFPRFAQFGGEQYLAFHYINEAMLQRGGEYWKKWFPIVRDKLLDVQNADGSWTGHSCIVSRTFCTACALLVLTSPNRYLSISQI